MMDLFINSLFLLGSVATIGLTALVACFVYSLCRDILKDSRLIQKPSVC